VVAVTVRVRLFAILRERAGRDSLELELPDGATVADAIDALAGEPGLEDVLERLPVAAAVNLEYAAPEAALRAGDELALVPPVSGGSGGEPGSGHVRARVIEQPLSLEAVSGAVRREGAGAIVVFQGTTRDVERLEYEAYSEMAERRIAAILADCVHRHGLEAAAADHRVGGVPLGDASVIVAVSAAHRAEAFAGAREAIDRIKAEAPIWKREVDAGTERAWPEGSPAPGAARRTA
jgi:molybdopterin synthase catalytic subunit